MDRLEPLLTDDQLKRGLALLRAAEADIRDDNRTTIGMTMFSVALALSAIFARCQNVDVRTASVGTLAGLGCGMWARATYEHASELRAGIVELDRVVTDAIVLRLSEPNRDLLKTIGIDLDTFDATKAFKHQESEEVQVESRILKAFEYIQQSVQLLAQALVG